MTKPLVLIPWDRDEAITVTQAAYIAKKTTVTMREWAAKHHIGRRVGGGSWMISQPALLMLLDGDDAALASYLGGDRYGPAVRPYFVRCGLLT